MNKFVNDNTTLFWTKPVFNLEYFAMFDIMTNLKLNKMQQTDPVHATLKFLTISK